MNKKPRTGTSSVRLAPAVAPAAPPGGPTALAALAHGGAPPAASPASLTPQEREERFTAYHRQWGVARAMIEREDELVHQRMTSYLTTQGFLFTAFGVLSAGWLGKAERAEPHLFIPVAVVLAMFCIVAITLAFHTKDAVDAAVKQIRRTVQWWVEYSQERLPEDNESLVLQRPFPPVIGQLPHGMVIDRHILYLSYAWTALFAVVFGAVVHRGCWLAFERLWLSWSLSALVAVTGLAVGVYFSRRKWTRGELPPSVRTQTPP